LGGAFFQWVFQHRLKRDGAAGIFRGVFAQDFSARSRQPCC
jgi:hypothetical protein